MTDPPRPVPAVLATLGDRQPTVFWRLGGMVRFLRGRTDGGVMTRRAFVIPEGSPKR